MDNTIQVPIADLQAQYHALRPEIDAAIARVLESGRFILGENVRCVEEEVAACCGARFGIGVASGTDALELSLAALGIGPGDEVITTPFTFGATTEVIVRLGAKPVYVDIDPDTYNIEVNAIERAITPRTRALLPVDLFGQMADRQALWRIAQEHGLYLVNDSAQAIGAQQNGIPVAAVGHATALSFYPTKNLGAFGDGGIVLTNDEQIARRVRQLRVHGAEGGAYFYKVPGYCSRLDEIQAAILRVKLRYLEEWNERRRQNAHRYMELLQGTQAVLPVTAPGNLHTYHQFTIRYRQRDALQAYLKQHGIATAVYYPLPLHLQEAYRCLGYKRGDFPHAERAAEEVLSLPVHPELSMEQIEYVAAMVRRFEEEHTQ
ncbi:MAG: glutamine--scyllo-inositol aminotransferase [Armatimonadota bacterium]|nr:MAG: glutamine--scyllo-inositol aminotransferase [Armatimonadota bacterium]